MFAFCKLSVVMILIALAKTALAVPIVISNSIADATFDYDVTINLVDDMGNPTGVMIETFDLGSGAHASSRTYGGKSGRGISKGKWVDTKSSVINKTRREKDGGKLGKLILGDTMGDVTLVAMYWDPTDTTDIFSFADFIGSEQLFSIVDFEFAGYEASNVPILMELATGDRITDSSGQLFEKYAYSGPLEAVTFLSAIEVPEPSSVSFAALLLLLVFRRKLFQVGGPN